MLQRGVPSCSGRVRGAGAGASLGWGQVREGFPAEVTLGRDLDAQAEEQVACWEQPVQRPWGARIQLPEGLKRTRKMAGRRGVSEAGRGQVLGAVVTTLAFPERQWGTRGVGRGCGVPARPERRPWQQRILQVAPCPPPSSPPSLSGHFLPHLPFSERGLWGLARLWPHAVIWTWDVQHLFPGF